MYKDKTYFNFTRYLIRKTDLEKLLYRTMEVFYDLNKERFFKGIDENPDFFARLEGKLVEDMEINNLKRYIERETKEGVKRKFPQLSMKKRDLVEDIFDRILAIKDEVL